MEYTTKVLVILMATLYLYIYMYRNILIYFINEWDASAGGYRSVGRLGGNRSANRSLFGGREEGGR